MKNLISELMDGEIASHAIEPVLKKIHQDQALRQEWDIYHLISDAFKQNDYLNIRATSTFHQRWQQEPTVLAPQRIVPNKVKAWGLSVAASVAAIAMVGWLSFNNANRSNVEILSNVKDSKIQFTQQAPLTNLAMTGAVREYLLAHQESLGSSGFNNASIILTTAESQDN